GGERALRRRQLYQFPGWFLAERHRYVVEPSGSRAPVHGTNQKQLDRGILWHVLFLPVQYPSVSAARLGVAYQVGGLSTNDAQHREHRRSSALRFQVPRKLQFPATVWPGGNHLRNGQRAGSAVFFVWLQFKGGLPGMKPCGFGPRPALAAGLFY